MRVLLLHQDHPAPPALAEYARRLGAEVATGPAEGEYDVAMAMDWAATAHLFGVRAKRHVFWVDHFAHRRLGTWQSERFAAQLAYDLPVDFVAAAPWVQATLADLRPQARCELVRSGAPDASGATAEADRSGPLRVHVPRDADRAALALMAEPHAEAPLDAADVVLMLSDVDGVLDAPLAGFRAGATAVVGPAHDADDLVVHDTNGFVADADDPRGAARFLDLLARDRELLARLRAAARETGAAWPTWEQSATELAAALERLLAEDPPPQASWPVRLMGDAIGAAAVFGREHATLTAEVHRLQAPPPPVKQRATAALKRRVKARLKG